MSARRAVSEAGDVVVKLPRGLSRRIEEAVGDPSLGYGTFDDFCLSAIRSELRRAERTAYFLREASS